MGPGGPGGPSVLQGNLYYQYVKDLSAGAFGFVQLARDRTNNEQVAIKFIPRGKSSINKYVQRELLNHSRLLHPHVVQFKEVFLTPQHLAIVMEYAAGGDMFQRVKACGGLKEEDARWFFQQLIIGLDYCHKMGVVNRDIKLENCLLDGSRRPLLKLCDFGYSKHESSDSVPKSKVGTPGYTAPEVLGHRKAYDGKLADLWSCGCMLYVMLFCEYPFERQSDPQDEFQRYRLITERIRTADWIIPPNMNASPELRSLFSRILVPDPHQRATILEITDHPWFSKGLPKGVMSMNDQCLDLKDQTAGYQSADQIRAIVLEAAQVTDGHHALIDEIMDEDDLDLP
ncbi:hypothetical protein WJX74_005516 [Apatococcus lobatus]|uniref:Protein kinase domain-containing protein n=1 Tax=Apatococcus lobatus TaxID=904363 RepID=A0AAW1QIR5_9CHLO